MGQLEYKTKWACVLEKSPEYFHEFRRKGTNVQARQSVDAIFQLYGYMTFNDNKYGILNNMEHAWVFRRIETADSEGKLCSTTGRSISSLMIEMVHSDNLPTKPSMLKAFVGTICLPKSLKLHLPGFIVSRFLLKYLPPDISVVQPSQLFVNVNQLFRRRTRTIQQSWTDLIWFCHLTFVFAILIVVSSVSSDILHYEALR